MSLIARLTIYVCPYCGAKHLDRYEARGSRCPHRGDYFEAVEMVPSATTQGAVSDPDALALALHHVFEGWVCHLPADDSDWRKYADEVLAHLRGQ